MAMLHAIEPDKQLIVVRFSLGEALPVDRRMLACVLALFFLFASADAGIVNRVNRYDAETESRLISGPLQ